MEMTETVKTVLAEMVEMAGADGVTEGQAIAEIDKRGHHFGYYETVNALKSVYKEMGLERTEPHTGKVICYYKPKKQPEASAAEKMAVKSARRIAGERQREDILNHYRR